MSSTFQFYSCLHCTFRFPTNGDDIISHCPACGQKGLQAEASYTSHTIPTPHQQRPALPIAALLDNIRSTYNVGSIFRTADGAGITHLHLCGITPTPDKNAKVGKTALGAEQSVLWHYHPNALKTAVSLQKQGYHLWAIEGGPSAQSLFDIATPLPHTPTLLIFGNERAGVDPAILTQCDHVLSIPMLGSKGSLNVTVAFGIAAYWISEKMHNWRNAIP